MLAVFKKSHVLQLAFNLPRRGVTAPPVCAVAFIVLARSQFVAVHE